MNIPQTLCVWRRSRRRLRNFLTIIIHYCAVISYCHIQRGNEGPLVLPIGQSVNVRERTIAPGSRVSKQNVSNNSENKYYVHREPFTGFGYIKNWMCSLDLGSLPPFSKNSWLVFDFHERERPRHLTFAPNQYAQIFFARCYVPTESESER